MKLKRMTIALIVVSLLAGGAASYGAKNYISDSIANYRSQLDGEYEKVRVVVASNDTLPGSPLRNASVSMREVPRAFLHKDSITEDQWRRYAGRLARSVLTAGAPVLASQLVDPDSGGLSETLEPGMRALTVPVDQISSISGLLAPGDRIDMLLTVANRDRDQTFPLLKDVLVLATGVDTRPPAQSSSGFNDKATRPFNTVTVLVDPEQAAKIVHAREVGSLTVVLRAEDDTSDGWPEKITLASLVGEKVRPKKKPVRKGVQVILGGQTRTK